MFVNDDAGRAVLQKLAGIGVRLVTLRCTGFNKVDLAAARELGLAVTRVPAYSPYSVAEHTVALILALNRKLHRAFQRVRELNFSLVGLEGFDLHGKTAGIVGTGKIGRVVAEILRGFGMRILACDPLPSPEWAARHEVAYADKETLARESDVLSLHVPLTPETRHMVRRETLAQLKPGALLVNVSRGALIDTAALIEALKQRRLGGVALDVYEEEERGLLRGSLRAVAGGRRAGATPDIPQRRAHRAPGVPHPRGPGRHRPRHGGQPPPARRRPAARGRDPAVSRVLS